MKQKYQSKTAIIIKINVFLTFLLAQFFGFGVNLSYAISTVQNCQNNICATLTSSLPSGSGSIDPNINVNLNFSVSITPSGGQPQCSNGKQIFHTIRHGIAGSATDYEYIASGSGPGVDYNFDSLTSGTKHRYYGMFYCWTRAISVVGGFAGFPGELWQTPELNLSTRAANITPTAIVSNASPTMGGTTNVIVQNPPTGSWSALIYVNDRQQGISMTNSPYSLAITAANGFNNTGTNTIVVQIFDSANRQVGNSTPITLNVGSAGGGGGGGGGAAGPTDALYNPLTQENLTDTFLVILQGLLSIIAIWAVIFIVIGGFQMVMAAGNEETYMKAKKTILWAVLGLIVALLSFSIVAIVENIIQADIKPVATGYHESHGRQINI